LLIIEGGITVVLTLTVQRPHALSAPAQQLPSASKPPESVGQQAPAALRIPLEQQVPLTSTTPDEQEGGASQ
jgi:hypothetical protein